MAHFRRLENFSNLRVLIGFALVAERVSTYLGPRDIRRNVVNASDLGVVLVEFRVLASNSFAVIIAAEESVPIRHPVRRTALPE
jgi:hypothetical protein